MTVIIQKGLGLVEKITVKVTEWIGTIQSIIFHTFFFIGIFALNFFGVDFDTIMLILTTAVSLEAIYLSIFIQMSVNRSGNSLSQISEDIEDINESVDEIEEDMEEMQEDVEGIGDNMASEEETTKITNQEIFELLQNIKKEMEVIKQNTEPKKEKIVFDMRAGK